MKKLFIGFVILSMLTLMGCNAGSDSRELELKEKELALKEKEMELKEKEAESDDSEESSSSAKKSATSSEKKSTSDAAKKDESTPKPTKKADPNAKDYFVILGSFPRSDKTGPPELVKRARDSGVSVKIIDTDKYPGLKGGLFAVVMGPFTKAEADKEVRLGRAIAYGAYVKSAY